MYPTHRTGVASQQVYDNTLRNATECKTTEAGLSLSGCYGGIPFPIPQNGTEAIWNHLLRVENPALDALLDPAVPFVEAPATYARLARAPGAALQTVFSYAR